MRTRIRGLKWYERLYYSIFFFLNTITRIIESSNCKKKLSILFKYYNKTICADRIQVYYIIIMLLLYTICIPPVSVVRDNPMYEIWSNNLYAVLLLLPHVYQIVICCLKYIIYRPLNDRDGKYHTYECRGRGISLVHRIHIYLWKHNVGT